MGTVFVNAVANLLCNSYANCKLHLSVKGGAKFAGDVLGNYPCTDEAWGKVVRVGVLQCGQRRTFVVPIELPASMLSSTAPYLEAHLTYHHSALDGTTDGAECRASAVGTARETTPDAAAALLRSNLVSCGYLAVEKPGEDAQKSLLTLAKLMLDSKTNAHKTTGAVAHIDAMRGDLGGRMLKALKGQKRFRRWGRHYLRAISRSHQLCLCANFMDPGLQMYGGLFFRTLRDRGDKVFLGIPMAPPRYKSNTKKKAARNRRAYVSSSAHVPAPAPAPAPTPATYYAGSGGGCFGPGSVVLVQDVAGNLKPTEVTAVRPGDVVSVAGNSTALVRCVARIARDAALEPLLRLPNGLEITPKHPVRMAGGQWCRPRDLPGAQRVKTTGASGIYHVYNFVLDSTHVLIVNNMECVTWGHGLSDSDAAHPYFGDMTAIERDLSGMPGWARGAVRIAGCHRDVVTHQVVGLCCGK